MIIRELLPVTIRTYTNSTDDYGQLRKIYSDRTAEMVIKISSQTNVSDPRYVDVTNVGVTSDKSIIAGNQVICGQDTYDVLYVIPSSRLTTVLMRKNNG